MKNSIISIIIFLSLCIFIYFVNSDVVNLLNYISDTSTKIEKFIEEDNLDKAKELSQELYSKLEIKDVLPSIYLNHTEYDSLSDEATKIYMYINENELPDTISSVRLLKNNAENLIELQKVSLKNIF